MNQFLRVPQWVVTSTGGLGDGFVTNMVIISPFEAQHILKTIEKHGCVVLHQYAPRSALGFEPLDRLLLYTTPAVPDNWKFPQSLIMQLNLFSGQLYFSSFPEYQGV